MDSQFEPRDPVEAADRRVQPKYDRLVMRGARFYLEGTLPTGEAFSVQLGPSDSSAGSGTSTGSRRADGA